ncbi:hypothetical protein KHC28_00510 [Ancylobacter sonchi]|uniref:hypothetical protein n=1 Tax=Ancylobacter sonchi TaxID=1937790 RepID=UPI001BD52C1A|nr:hypothetical protein [Ancylobacter sonchi]MBS7532147.1 hypothetical protein [Ancylobacter sonchi]
MLLAPGADRAILDIPTGLVIVDRGHNTAHGDPAELRRYARAILAACDAAEAVTQVLPPAPHFLDHLVREGI